MHNHHPSILSPNCQKNLSQKYESKNKHLMFSFIHLIWPQCIHNKNSITHTAPQSKLNCYQNTRQQKCFSLKHGHFKSKAGHRKKEHTAMSHLPVELPQLWGDKAFTLLSRCRLLYIWLSRSWTFYLSNSAIFLRNAKQQYFKHLHRSKNHEKAPVPSCVPQLITTPKLWVLGLYHLAKQLQGTTNIQAYKAILVDKNWVIWGTVGSSQRGYITAMSVLTYLVLTGYQFSWEMCLSFQWQLF